MAEQQFTPEEYEFAIAELMEFVTTHLDPDPSKYWADYVTEHRSMRLLGHAQARHTIVKSFAGLDRGEAR